MRSASFTAWRQLPARYRLPLLVAGGLLAGTTSGALLCQPAMQALDDAHSRREQARTRLDNARTSRMQLALLPCAAPLQILREAASRHALAFLMPGPPSVLPRNGLQQQRITVRLTGPYAARLAFLRGLDRQDWSSTAALRMAPGHMELDMHWLTRCAPS